MNEGNGQLGAALMIYDWKRRHACLDGTLLLYEVHLLICFLFCASARWRYILYSLFTICTYCEGYGGKPMMISNSFLCYI